MDSDSDMKQKLEELFKNSPVVSKNEQKNQIKQIDNDVEDTHAFVDKSLKRLMQTTEEVVNEAAEVAKQTGEPEHFKAFAQVIKEMGKLTTNVLDILKIKKEMIKEENPPQTPNPSDISSNTTNVFISGSLSDVLKKIKEEENKGKVIDVEPIQEE